MSIPNGHGCFYCDVASEWANMDNVTHLVIVVVEMLIVDLDLAFKD